jgi:tRNA A-37 threonylcarbamoyl transferase component Bud32
MARVKCPHCFHVNPDQQENCQKCSTLLPRIRIEARSVINDAPAPQGKMGPQLRRGQVVAGRYTVLNLVGQGGMGCIYKVHDNTIGEDLALKTLLPQFLDDKIVLERFYNEARIARRLAHQNIVRVHDIGEDGKVLYISMEFLQGMSLREILENLKPGERLPIAQTLRIFDELCAALEYAHQFTIHRDIKPENVMLGQDGLVRLMDFGISKLMSGIQLTGASVVMGTPFYMSPEQIRNSRDVDARSDIYSVGVMLYEILTGSVPTGVPKPASQIMSDVPPALDKIVVKCVDPDPKARYQNVTELRCELLAIRDMVKSGLTAPRKNPAVNGSRPYSMKKVGGALAALLVVALGIWSLVRAEDYRKTEAAVEPPPVNTAPGVPAPLEPTFAAYESICEALRSKAEPNVGHTGVRSALKDGNGFWAEAVQANDNGNVADALFFADSAFQCYLALLMAPEVPGDMVFVKPGFITLPGQQDLFLDGFFIDRTEVTLGQYRNFSRGEKAFEALPEYFTTAGSDYDKIPISDVSCIDAMAFAAKLGNTLPTDVQWLRAATFGDSDDVMWPDGTDLSEDDEPLYNLGYASDLAEHVGSFPEDKSHFDCLDMVGNVSEWTQSSNGKKPTFASIMTVCGGNYSEAFLAPLDSRRPMPFEAHALQIGFRCVKEVPSGLSAVRAYLNR